MVWSQSGCSVSASKPRIFGACAVSLPPSERFNTHDFLSVIFNDVGSCVSDSSCSLLFNLCSLIALNLFFHHPVHPHSHMWEKYICLKTVPWQGLSHSSELNVIITHDRMGSHERQSKRKLLPQFPPLITAGAVFPLQQSASRMGVEHLCGGGQRTSGRAQVSWRAAGHWRGIVCYLYSLG